MFPRQNVVSFQSQLLQSTVKKCCCYRAQRCLPTWCSSISIVHAPSGKTRLTDQQRQTLLTNLLQSNSKSMPGQTIGSARYCYRAWLLSDHRSDLGSPISLGHCYRAWLSSDPRSELASPIAFSATAAEHGWQYQPARVERQEGKCCRYQRSGERGALYVVVVARCASSVLVSGDTKITL